MGLEFEVLGVAKNLVKHVVHLYENFKTLFYFLQDAQTSNDKFLVSRVK
jgi:hypothetical protein